MSLKISFHQILFLFVIETNHTQSWKLPNIRENLDIPWVDSMEFPMNPGAGEPLWNSLDFWISLGINEGYYLHSPETNSSPLKIGHPKKDGLVFQPSIFRRYIGFREG